MGTLKEEEAGIIPRVSETRRDTLRRLLFCLYLLLQATGIPAAIYNSCMMPVPHCPQRVGSKAESPQMASQLPRQQLLPGIVQAPTCQHKMFSCLRGRGLVGNVKPQTTTYHTYYLFTFFCCHLSTCAIYNVHMIGAAGFDRPYG